MEISSQSIGQKKVFGEKAAGTQSVTFGVATN
jgi:hypothetical protein